MIEVRYSEQLARALEGPLFTYSREGSDNHGRMMAASSEMIALLLAFRRTGEEKYAKKAAQHLKYMVGPDGHGPAFTLEPYWNYCPVTAAVALAKETPDVWNLLTDEEKDTYDFVMATFGRILAFGTADENDYRTGPGMRGNFCKSWNPNYRLANVTPMLFVGHYFGGAANVDEILASFSYDETVERMRRLGWQRSVDEWTTEPPTLPDGTKAPAPRDFLENGGPAYLRIRGDGNDERLHIFEGKPAGDGKGVRVNYRYQEHTVDEAAAIFNLMLAFNYSGGPVQSSLGENEDGSPKAYILDGTKSPYEGQIGMMKEFASGDGGGIRSSCGYCSHDFIMVCAALAVLTELGMYDVNAPENAEIMAKVRVGNADFLYKYEHGYMNYSLGKARESGERDADGYLLWKAWWQENYGR